MSYFKILIVFTALIVAGCGGAGDDLRPSGEDKRPVTQSNSGQEPAKTIAMDFTVSNSLGDTVNLYDTLAGSDGVVMYFTMWCSVCAAHMDHMAASVMPNYPNVRFFVVDYVSGSVSNTRSAQIENGYENARFGTLVDANNSVLRSFNATMGTTVVINKSKEIIMSEDYKDGSQLKKALDGIQG